MPKLGGVVYVDFDDPKLSYSYSDPDYSKASPEPSTAWPSIDVPLLSLGQVPPSGIQPSEPSLELQVEVPISNTPALQVQVPIQAVTPTPRDVEIPVEDALESMYFRKQRKRAQIKGMVKVMVNTNLPYLPSLGCFLA